jgi:large conductance mechanosensitive channel
LTFVSIAAAVFFFVVAPIAALQRRRTQIDPETKDCPGCSSPIPIGARRCSLCTSVLEVAPGVGPA